MPKPTLGLWRYLALAVSLTIAVAVVVGIHVYVVSRLVTQPGWYVTTAAVDVVIVGMSIGLMVAAMLAERFVTPPWSRIITWPGYLWMGYVLLLFFGLVAADLLMWATNTLGDHGWQRGRAIAVLVGAGLLTIWGVRRALYPGLRQIEVSLARWPAALDGFRIVQISDLHIGPILGRRWARGIVARVNALRGDLVVITGDLIDGFVDRVAPETEPLSELHAPHGVFAITGNHEMFCGPGAWTDHYEERLGLDVLCNACVRLGEGDARLWLAGTHDRSGRYFGHAEDLDAALACAGEKNESEPVILLAHDPLTFRDAANRRVDLQLSGHTHGGQIWPLHAFVRLAIPYLAGHYEHEGSQLYVSRGTGFWGPPMRLLAPAEITEITIRTQP